MPKIIFFGTPDFSLPALSQLIELGLVKAVVTRADKLAGRGQKLADSPVAKLAVQHDLPLLKPAKLDAGFSDELKKYLPSTFVIVAYGKIIPQAVLDLSEQPALNIHPSLLPALRGPSPIQSALLQGLTETGVSLMQLDKEMDHGPLLAQVKLTVSDNDNSESLSSKLATLGADLLSRHINDYLAGKLAAQPQADNQATYCKLLTKADGLIDWRRPAKEIHNQIRALNPWPSTFFTLAGQTFKLLEAEISGEKLAAGRWQIQADELLIGTMTTALSVKKIQPSNRRVMTAQEFINGYRRLIKG